MRSGAGVGVGMLRGAGTPLLENKNISSFNCASPHFYVYFVFIIFFLVLCAVIFVHCFLLNKTIFSQNMCT